VEGAVPAKTAVADLHHAHLDTANRLADSRASASGAHSGWPLHARLIGLLLIIEPWNMHTTLLSKFLGVTAALCWAIATVLIKRLRSKHPVDLLSLTTWQMLIGSVPLVLLAIFVPEHPTEWSATYIGIACVHVRDRHGNVLVVVDHATRQSCPHGRPAFLYWARQWWQSFPRA